MQLHQEDNNMELGTFSVSLSVKDIKASRAFYEKLGLEVIGGKEEQNWLIMRSGTTIIGLFHGMFEGNGLTFNPTDVRGLQRALKGKGITFTSEADESTTGPAHATLVDPDGNVILFDQH
jgi:lactoylglutathione lyase